MAAPHPRGGRDAARLAALSCAVVCAEELEPRLALHGDDGLLSQSTQLTLSFAPDGTDVAGEASSLYARLDATFSRADWQQTVLRAMQTWLVHTAVDLGVVADQGLPLGTPGPTTGDSRFGDIRLAAHPLANDVMAISMSQDSLLSGTWAGDIILNSQTQFHSVDELFSVILHETGHVLGLPHSDDAASPMHVHGASAAMSLTPTDIQLVQQRHGQRPIEAIANDQLSQATRLRWPAASGDSEGRTPALGIGEISPGSDVDVYWVRGADPAGGPLTVRLQTQAVSQLAPRLSILDQNGSLLQQAAATGFQNRDLTLTIPQTVQGDTYYLRVQAAAADELAAVGGYALVVTQDNRLTVDVSKIDPWLSGPLRLLTDDDITSLFDDEDGLVREDNHTDDDTARAIELESAAQFAAARRYDTLGSLTNRSDTDFYRFDSPESETSLVMNVAIRSLDPGGLIPSVAMFADDTGRLPHEVLVNGGGELLVQTSHVQPDRHYYIQVTAADGSARFQSGNYQLTVTFSSQPTELPTVASGVVPSIDVQQQHRLYVATPQLFHFTLTTASPTTADQGLRLTMLDSQGRTVHRIVAPAGETRSAGSALLLPGLYTVIVSPLVVPGRSFVATSYSIRGRATSDPLAVDPVNPGDLEYACPNLPGWYCYPAGIVSEVPYLWDNFLDTLPVPPVVDTSEQVSTLIGDWWLWYWQTKGPIGPPLAIDDAYDVPEGSPLHVHAAAGVLANDIDPQADGLTSAILRQPDFGTVQLELDGSFNYLPPPGFVGLDSFEYEALDFRGESSVAQVTLRVGSAVADRADFNADGIVNAVDIQQLAVGLRTAAGMQFDLNLDQVLDAEDWRVMIYDVMQSSFGDANLDRQFNSADLVEVFQSGEYEDQVASNSTWQEGDWNGDGEFDSSDLVQAFQTGLYEATTQAFASPLAAAIDWLFAQRQRPHRSHASVV